MHYFIYYANAKIQIMEIVMKRKSRQKNKRSTMYMTWWFFFFFLDYAQNMHLESIIYLFILKDCYLILISVFLLAYRPYFYSSGYYIVLTILFLFMFYCPSLSNCNIINLTHHMNLNMMKILTWLDVHIGL